VAAILVGGLKCQTQFLEEDHPRIISAKFGWDWLSSFRGESHWMVLFQKCVRQFGPWTKMNMEPYGKFT
jgi:hypothetical protein